MQYLVTQIVWYLLGAAAIGSVMGWLLRAVAASRRTGRAEEIWKRKLKSTEDSWGSKLRLAEESFSSQLDEKAASISGLTGDVETQRGQVRTLSDIVEGRSAELQQLQDRYEVLNERLVIMDGRLAASLGDFDEADVERRALVAQLEKASEELENARSERNTEREALQLARGKLEALESEVDSSRASLDTSRGRVRELEPLVDHVRERDDQIELLEREHAAQLEAREADVLRARAKMEELERLRDELDGRLDALKGEHAAVMEEHGQTVAERDAEIERLSRRLASLAQMALEGSTEDDLKRIKGIGPVLERTLKGLGYRTFRDLASWDEADVRRVAKEMDDFPERIHRDDWIGQAHRLSAEANGERP